MPFLETFETLTVVGGVVGVLCLPVGGLFWFLLKTDQQLHRHVERKSEMFYQHSERSKRLSQVDLWQSRLQNLNDEEFAALWGAVSTEARKRQRPGDVGMGATERRRGNRSRRPVTPSTDDF